MRAARAVLVGLLTVGLLYLALRSVDLRGLLRSLAAVSPGWLLAATALSLLHYILRAARWGLLLAPSGGAPFAPLLTSTLAGYALNNLLPARIGEVVRPVLLARRTSIPVSAGLATIVLERLFDVLAILALFGLALPLLMPGWAGEQRDRADRLIFWGGILAVASAAGLAGLAWAVRRGAALPGPARALLDRLPRRTGDRLRSAGRGFAEGLAALRSGRLLIPVAAYSLAIWVGLAASLWMVGRSVGAGLTAPASGFMMAILALGMAVPTPGGVGGYHFACTTALTLLFDVPPEPAAAVALLSHATGYVPATLLGLAVLAREGVRPSQAAATAAAASAAPGAPLGGKP